MVSFMSIRCTECMAKEGVTTVLLALGLLLCALATPTRAFMPSDLPVELQVLTPPTPVHADGGIVLAYELHVTNFRETDLSLEHVLIYDQADTSRPLVTYPEDGPFAKIWHPGVAGDSDPRIIHGGQRVVIFFWVTLPRGHDIPKSLSHRLVFAFVDPKGEELFRMVEGGVTPVVQRNIQAYLWPADSGNWLVANGPSVSSEHRLAMHALDGRTSVAQRFAADFMKIGPDGRLWHGSPTRNENWYGYGQPVRAVADGEVASVLDGVLENTPLAPTRAVRLTRTNISGNYVLLKVAEQEYVLYGHLVPGGITVKIGQRVKQGDVLGYIGNSGNSDAPHLHFHVVDGPAPLASEGIPYEFMEFHVLSPVKPTDLDSILSSGELPGLPAGQPEVDRKHEMPTGDMMIHVP
jgi:murein DD-endopeptidase